ncbi:hypothetical protein THICB1_150123 [Thiomonas arsenitoxydans]|uniref:Uncharacterized protein n=1 Tax=Thiomonas arsenitoxydans (strain DSM 22701 / CIP 110005 / 3As) TaxID=426114 RepID=A0ABP1Z329_THIA3|nr:hypothetical protein ACO3_170012 [Thiomonas arsenitoxydans]CQR29275.1 hypothetical protein ACO7_150012 [Thiomonas arsenitoxydans]CQR30793.1 hypothetical protein THICB1_150123 [Thiomonas arsenitoxydans]CQR35374.1 hypothetical protein THICB6_220002 [Thiomonas arsenitoxydans]
MCVSTLADTADVGALILEFAPHDIVWLLPVIRGMVHSVPITMFASRIAPTHWLRRLRLLLTPEETDPPASSPHCRPVCFCLRSRLRSAKPRRSASCSLTGNIGFRLVRRSR